MMRSRWVADSVAVASVTLLAGAFASYTLAGGGLPTVLIPFSLGVAGFSGVGWLLARRVPDNGVGWSFSVGGFFWALMALATALGQRALDGPDPVRRLGRLWLVLPDLAWILPMVFSIQLPLLLLPTGRLLSARWRWAVRATGTSVVLCLTGFFTYAARIDGTDPRRDLKNPFGVEALGSAPLVVALTGAVLIGVVLISGGVCVVLRYRRSRGVERQQLRWVAFGGCCAVLSQNVGLIPGVPDTVSSAAGVLMFSVPVCIGVAVLRYRLYDLGRLVSRTVSYGVLSGLLVGTYVGLISITTRIVPDGSSFAVAASTLAAAALFQPLRRRIQTVVDSRFNRARYDADRTVEVFTRTLREEVDLDAVRSDLLRTVERTVQPQLIGLWLRDAGR